MYSTPAPFLDYQPYGQLRKSSNSAQRSQFSLAATLPLQPPSLRAPLRLPTPKRICLPLARVHSGSACGGEYRSFDPQAPEKKAGTHQSPGRRARAGPRWKLLAPSKILGRWRFRRRGGSLLAWGRREADARAVEEKGGQADGALGQGAVGPACSCGEDEGEGWDQAGLHSCGQG
jgi:hypothetical protein